MTPAFPRHQRGPDDREPCSKVDTARTPGFAEVLRESTKLVHREAERCGFIADLIHGRATRHGYAVYLRNLEPVYAALEQGLDARRPDRLPVVVAFADPRLRRLPALHRDLVAIVGADWAVTCPLLPGADVYAATIASASRGDGLRLAAHAYARYLGDLSGGQILRPLLARTLGLQPDALGIYDFPEIANLAAEKAALRDALDSVTPNGPDADDFVAEAVAAFRHTIAVSIAVSMAVGAVWTPVTPIA